MFVLKTKINLGYSGGRIALVDATNEMATKYLSVKSSLMFIAMINLEHPMEQFKFLVDSGLAKDLMDAKRRLREFIPSVKDYVYDFDEYFQIDKTQLRKIDIFRLTESAKTTSMEEYRLAYPATLVWVPTWKCNRSCLYCGVAKIKPNEQEDRLASDKAYKMLEEIVQYGMNSITIHGGEPLFCYGDEIFDYLKYLTSHGVSHIAISTKNHISKEMAEKIWESGLRELQLSLDAIDDELLYTIYGEKNYLSKFERSVQHLQEQNIKINVNIVASTLNYQYIPALLDFLNNKLINSVSMSPYRVGPNNPKDYTLSDEQVEWLEGEIMKLSDSFVFDKITGAATEGPDSFAKDRAVCAAGRTSFLFLPNGHGCYCDYLSEKQNFIFGDLSKQSIKEIWESEELIEFLHPNKSDFEGTSCYDCGHLTNCATKGICYLRTPADRKYGSDNKCIECKQGVI